MANFADVPIAALQRSTGLPPTGTGSYARSCAPTPVPFGVQMIHTSAEPAFVESEVITAALELKPKASEEVPCSDSVGWPVPDTPYW